MKIFTNYFAAVCMILAATTASAIDWDPKEVRLTVSNSLSVIGSNQGSCTRGPTDKNGCLRFDQDVIGMIKFRITGNPTVRSCADKGTKWVITQIELANSGYLMPNGTTISNKGIFDGGVPNSVKDSFPDVNPSDGMLLDVTKDEANTQASFINLNKNATTDPTDIWYQVTVTSCGDEDIQLSTDPRFENEGTN